MLIDNSNEAFRLTIAPYQPAITLFRNYVQKARGFRPRERERFNEFIVELVGSHPHDQKGFAEFALSYRRWDTYNDPLEFNPDIPSDQLRICRRSALRIAGGSGRRPIAEDALQLIDSLFPRLTLGE